MTEYEEYDEYDEYDEYYDEPPGLNRRWLIIAIVIVALLLCCCCLAVVAGAIFFGEDILNELQTTASLIPTLGGMAALV
ncbi:MAG: hypothetical protein JSV81_02685 [Anaerolineales bacterium]|nr:MAG: hypothetical protein JSV81_02685 [Anaerolineales bacterium]